MKLTQLHNLMLESGLIQFGSFSGDDTRSPILLLLEMLGSYPDVLSTLAEAAQAKVAEGSYARLLCPADALPFGVAVSLKTGVPLVYSRGRGESAVVDLVGGYDIGHRTLLLLNTLDGDPFTYKWLGQARGVGLETTDTLAILSLLPRELDHTSALLRLDDLVSECAARGELPAGHAAAVQAWMARL
jgi:hypothetical protein